MPKLHTLTPYNRLLIHSGNVIELYEYEMPVLRGGTFSRKGRANAPFTSDETKRDNRNKTAARARTRPAAREAAPARRGSGRPMPAAPLFPGEDGATLCIRRPSL